ncbi:hypothetical protein Aph02nite_68400 [Actinoplanes philippinensis]|nr:hypothetical protein Aph02nite_68400 [Actinoplanes philippinensis]
MVAGVPQRSATWRRQKPREPVVLAWTDGGERMRPESVRELYGAEALEALAAKGTNPGPRAASSGRTRTLGRVIREAWTVGLSPRKVDHGAELKEGVNPGDMRRNTQGLEAAGP